jgi:hypothetical protein
MREPAASAAGCTHRTTTFHLWCEFEQMKRPGCPRSLADTADHSIALQHRELRSHAIRRKTELSRKLFGGQRTALE